MSTLTSGQPTVVSASGKVLLAGGYLILERKYSGMVIGTSARFYTVIYSGKNKEFGKFSVYSPQFDDGKWDYRVNLGGEDDVSCKLESM